MSSNLLQQLSSLPNVGGGGVPVQQYAATLQQVLTKELTSVPNQQIDTLASTSGALNSVEAALAQFQSATQSLASVQSWTPTVVTSSNPAAFTVSGGQGAPTSSFSVSVTSLAQSQLEVAQVSLSVASASGTFYIYSGNTAAGTPLATISVSSGESLASIVSAINQTTSTSNVQAFVLGNGNLAVESTLTGAKNAFTLADATGSNFISTQTSMSITQKSSDAVISIAGTTVNSSTNTFANVVPGVTLTVLASGASGTLNITQDSSKLLSNVKSWMDSYNRVVDILHSDTSYIPSATGKGLGQAGPLVGDAAAAGLLSQLPGALNTLLPSSSTLQSLSSVGIILDPNNGHMEWQSSAGFKANGKSFPGSLQDGQTLFQNAMATNSSAVETLFGVVQNTSLSTVIPNSGVLGNVNNVLNEFLGFGSSSGIISNELTSISSQTTSLNTYLKQVEQTITDRVNNFTMQLNALNASLAHAQSQMKTLGALLASGSSSTSSSGSSSSTTTTG